MYIYIYIYIYIYMYIYSNKESFQNFQINYPELSWKITTLKYFRKCPGEHRCWIPFLSKSRGL